MSSISRREFVAGCVMLAGGAMVRAKPLGLPIGSQTYPHRQMIRDGNFAGLLDTLKEIGVESIELCSPFGYTEFASLSDGKAVRALIAGRGLKCESSHFGLRELRENQQRSIDWAHDAGITQMYVASLGGASPTMDDVKRAADEYNRIAAVAAKAGIQQGLHNEGFETSTVDGRRTYDILLELLDPVLVKFQFQMSTINRGFIAADYFTKYPGRFISMHIQDVDPSTTPDRIVQAAVGQGTIDWAATFRAARTGGVRSYYVEQTMELTKASVAALQRMQA